MLCYGIALSYFYVDRVTDIKKLTDSSVIKKNRGIVHGSRRNLTFITLFQYTSNAHKIQQTHNNTKFLCYKY